MIHIKDNFEEYEDPYLYDVENKIMTEYDLLFEFAKDTNGTVIDLACGTGRLTVPLAENGIPIVGIDLHEGMLRRAMDKAKDLPIKWIKRDITKLALQMKSSLIYMVGNSFQHFLTNEAQEKALVNVANHLEQDGIFIFNTRFPSKEELLQPEAEEYWQTYKGKEGVFVDVFTISKYNPITQIQHL
ncbi:class I SAM-dependent DNA methyltransferase [Bacillus aquiflavi]|uniref:class I SAM-dependent DNA methyltransferase n=1 Tax=Bacillus aquiflavi TaxID=2672567 RepID=UPI002867C5B5|nr:class I SAM-dependent methyltransferase [Bacillus aquiflavi]